MTTGRASHTIVRAMFGPNLHILNMIQDSVFENNCHVSVSVNECFGKDCQQKLWVLLVHLAAEAMVTLFSMMPHHNSAALA